MTPGREHHSAWKCNYPKRLIPAGEPGRAGGGGDKTAYSYDDLAFRPKNARFIERDLSYTVAGFFPEYDNAPPAGVVNGPLP